jgi:hypothetical protein
VAELMYEKRHGETLPRRRALDSFQQRSFLDVNPADNRLTDYDSPTA